ncbi:MAG: methyl-accepting chemotaxis protein [Treponema sp.]|nr:methyl-accepting chemotaxis protein [Treponema sp.]
MDTHVKFPLRHKIRIALAVSILLCSVTTLTVAMVLFSNAIRTSTQNGLKTTIAGWNSEVTQMETFLKAAAQSVSNNAIVKQDMELQDYSVIKEIVKTELRNFDFDYLSIVNAKGTVVAAGNMYHADNRLGSLSVINSALRGSIAVEFETPGNTQNFSLMAACPITEAVTGRVLGAVVTGYDLVARDTAASIKARFGSECTIFEGDTRVNTTLSDTSGRALTGTQLQNSAIREQVITHRKNYYGDTTIYQKEYLAAYSPIIGSSGEFKGMIFVADDISIITSIQKKALSILIPLIATIALSILILATVLIKNMLRPMYALQQSFGKMAKGDLTERIDTDSKDELGLLVKEFNVFSSEINKTISEVKHARDALKQSGDIMNGSTENTASAITQIASSIDSIKQQIFSQTSSVSQTVGAVQQISTSITTLESMIENQSSGVAEASAAVEEMIENIASVNKSMDMLALSFKDLQSDVERGSSKQKDVNAKIRVIEMQSQMLQEANKIISNIASQTNLLAMNAAIEAAHAGDAGKGFAVVSGEIRKLSETSSKQSRTIGDQLAKIQDSIKAVVEASGDTSAALTSVSTRIQATDSLVYQIKIAMDEQNEGSNQIREALKYMNDSTSEVRNASKEMTEGNTLILNEIQTLQQSTHSISSNMKEVSIGTDRIQEAGESLRNTSINVRDSILAIDRKIDVFTVATA